ncbi:MAG: glycosyltransferase family protein [Campylobacterota bacterium]|nr:glycosyltransferase family protein [Campylobacterota bacterium]
MNLAILQARMGSTRLPNKVLKEINGKPMLAYECERIKRSKKIDDLIIATSTDPSDDAIEDFAYKNDIKIYRGDLSNVLSRYYNCAVEYKQKNETDNINIVRVTGDCPIIDPIVIDEVIESFEKFKCDYTSNTLEPTYPDGMDIEICKFEALESAYKSAVYKSDMEHVTLYIKNSEEFSKFNYRSKYDFSHIRLTVDEKEDFELIKIIIENIYDKNPQFSYMDVISFMTKNPNLLFINSNITRDEGLKKSLKEDGRI